MWAAIQKCDKAMAVALRKTLLVSLDDLMAVVREFLNLHVSHSGLNRCLRQHSIEHRLSPPKSPQTNRAIAFELSFG